MKHFSRLFLKFKSNLLTRRNFCLLVNAAIVITILDIISSAHQASFVIRLPR